MTTSKWVAVGNSFDRNKISGQIGYSDDGLTWKASTQLGGLFDDGAVRGVIVNAQGRFVAVGSRDNTGQIGYSDDNGITWTASPQLGGLFKDGVVYGVTVNSQGRFVAVGTSGDGSGDTFTGGQIGYSDDDGLTWKTSPKLGGLFKGIGDFLTSGAGLGVTVNNQGRFVVVGRRFDGTKISGQIGYSDDGLTWKASTQLGGLFDNGAVNGVTVNSQGRFVAVGNITDFNGIVYSDDGVTWKASQKLNGLFYIGNWQGVSVNSQGRFVAVGNIGINFTNVTGQIGYSDDGLNWKLSDQLGGLFGGGGGGVERAGSGFSVTVNSQGRFLAVGTSGNDNIGKIGYSDDEGLTWKVSPQIGGLFTGLGGLFKGGIGYGVAVYTPPLANICFPAGTLIDTDQGAVAIERLLTSKHTIKGKHIAHVTRTQSTDAYLIQFQKNALERNSPDRTTVMSKDHKILFKGKLVPAHRFLNYSKLVKRVKYKGEVLYNVLFAEYGSLRVHNMTCESLDPSSPIACDYLGVAYKEQEAKRKVNMLHA